MKIGILETGLLPSELSTEYGSYSQMFVTLLGGGDEQLSFVNFRVIEDQFPESVDECDGYLITGSKHAAYEDLPWIHRLKDFVREIHAAKRPMLGICFGHQVIAEALGGKVEKFSGGWGVGRHEYQLQAPVVGLPTDQKTLTINAFHQDQITQLPKGASVFASSEFCPYAGLSYGDTILTVQAHPEFTNQFETALTASERASMVPGALRTAALDDLARPDATIDTPLLSQMMREFLLQGR